ncbi:membrane-spanning 4-domains subfamily A member 8-like [Kryptolebias marmoratus]|uniref:Membrane-spanning 4-domains subfamily A member 8-like n=1 Tax=Kryptolebias marmoratus TaxID=37003 RepID=A0A3Q3AUK7_KRYMA|nr:membrane-spanning 4-domains subfamily A member 8-like [Kryptolebias marmoratus]
MSVTVTKNDGVTVLTMSSDPENIWPPLCQIISNLCYSPKCCSVSGQLRKAQRTSLSVLGAIQIMIGLLNIGLGLILLSRSDYPWDFVMTGFPFWSGALFIVFGVMCILTEKFPSLCLIILNVTLNLAGVAFAITAMVLYIIHVADLVLVWWRSCEDYPYWYPERTTRLPSPYEARLSENCIVGKKTLLTLLRGINSVLIVLSVLELCVVISTVVIGIKELKSSKKKENQSPDEPEYCKLQPEKIVVSAA